MAKRSRRRRAAWLHAAGYLVFGIVWIFGTDYGLSRLGPADPALLTRLAALKGIGFVALSALWFYLVLRQMTAKLPSEVLAPRSPSRPLLIFLGVVVAVVAIGHTFLRAEERVLREGRYRELAGLAEATAAGLARAIDTQRVVVAQVLGDHLFGTAARQWQRSRDSRLHSELRELLQGMKASGGFYQLGLYGSGGSPLIVAGQAAAIPSSVGQLIDYAAAMRQPQFSVVERRSGSQQDSIVWVVPVLAREDPLEAADLFVIAFADFGSLRRGLVGPSPALGRTAETLLIVGTGTGIRFASGPAKDAGGSKETARDSAVARAAASGQTSLIEGLDYAGDRVLGVARPVEGTSYHVLAKIDDAEAFASLRYTAVGTGLAILAILAAAALALWAWWRSYQALLQVRLASMRGALDLQREHFAMANRYANDAVLLWDADRRLIEVNDRAVDMYGLERDALVRLRVDDLRDGADGPTAAVTQFERVMADGRLRFEALHRRGDGTTFPVEVSSRRFELDGRPYVQSIVRDISERRRSEAALRESEARYRSLFEANPHPMWVYDLETLKFMAVNDAAIQHYGYSREQFLAMTIADIRPSVDVPRLLANVQKVRDGVLDAAGLWRHRKADGSLIDVEIRSHVLDFAGRQAELVLANDVTHRLKLERQLHESEGRLRLFIEHAPAALAMFDHDMRYLAVSARWLKDYHLGSRNLVGQCHYEVFPEVDETWKAAHRRGLAGETVRADEDPFLRADGSLQWLRWEIHPWYRDEGDIGGIMIFSEEISDIVETHRRLERRTRLYDLLSQCNQAVMHVDDKAALYREIVRLAVRRGGFSFAWIGEPGRDGRLVPAALSGFRDEQTARLDELLGSKVAEDDAPAVRALRAGIPVLCDDLVNDPTGSPSNAAMSQLGVSSVGSFAFNEQGKPAGVLTVCADEAGFFDSESVETLQEVARNISFALDSLRTRRDLFESRQLLEKVADSSTALIYVTDPAGRFLLINGAAARAMGHDRVQVLGRTRAELMPQHMAVAHRANDQRVLNSGRTETFEEFNHEADGDHVYLSVKYPLQDAQGRIYAVGGISTDVTELLRARRALEEANRTLEERVVERTRELEEARDQALAADRAKTSFLATMSHELRSPLNSIIGFTALLLEGASGPLASAQQEQLRIVHDASLHLLDIINDILDLAKIEAGAVVVSRAEFDMQELARRVADRFSVLAAGKGLYLRLEGEKSPVTMAGDPRHVEQVLGNLLSNAIKFTSTGGVTVSVAADGGVVRVVVADTGPGISEADRPRLFQLFSQLEPADGALAHGTGLGLAIARHLAEAMGGSIELESEPGAGSRFSLVLPTAPH